MRIIIDDRADGPLRAAARVFKCVDSWINDLGIDHKECVWTFEDCSVLMLTNKASKRFVVQELRGGEND